MQNFDIIKKVKLKKHIASKQFLTHMIYNAVKLANNSKDNLIWILIGM